MEDILQYVWRLRLLPLKPLFTTHGIPLEVIDAGIHNNDAGPDFLQAKIKLGDTIWAGHVEVHLRSSDWFVHGHHTNPAYDMVVLHVVLTADTEICNSHGEEIPQLVVSIPKYILDRYEQLSKTAEYPRCHTILRHLSPFVVHSWMNALQAERMNDRQLQIHQRLERLGGDWNDCLFTTLARNFGFGLNGDAFEEWASSFSLRSVDKHRDNLMQVEAIFFGQAGLLSEQAFPEEQRVLLKNDAYWMALSREYAYLSHKFELSPIDVHRWKLLRTRPNNFPHIRIAQLAFMYYRQALHLSALLECTDLDQIRNLLQTDTSPYWKDHLGFGLPSAGMHRQLTSGTKDLLLINSLIPFLVAYRTHRLQDTEEVLSWYEQLKPENNRFIRLWAECGIEPQHAGDTQALIQLKKEYCDARRCLHCRFGFYYMCKDTL